jgi:hypothetical protein
MINPNKLGRSPFPASASQWMLVGLRTTTPATGYSLSGPSSGIVGVPSSNFTVALTGGTTVPAPVTITPSAGGGGGTFTPSTVILNTGSTSATFTYTAASAGAKTISCTNSGTLTNPGNLTYTASASGLVDDDPVSTWTDSSGNGHHAAMTGSNRPTFKTAILNGKPVVRFNPAAASKLELVTQISSVTPYTILAVMQTATPSPGVDNLTSLIATTSVNPCGPFLNANVQTNLYIGDRSNLDGFNANTFVTSGLFVIWTGVITTTPTYTVYANGTSQGLFAAIPNASAGDFTSIGWVPSTPQYCHGDIAEIIMYNSALSGTDRANVEKYLGTKYGITVAGGTAVQPDSVTGLLGWWKADSLL